MKPMIAEWTFYGDADLPLWLVSLGLILLFGALYHWLRTEMASRRHPLAWILPFTLVLLCLLLGWIAYNPVLIKTTTWQENRETVAVIDQSRSMELPLAPGSLPARLDLLALFRGSDLDGRTRSGVALSERLQELTKELIPHRAAAERLAGLEAQGIPAGPEQEKASTSYSTWRVKATAELSKSLSFFESDQAKLPAALQAADSPLTLAREKIRTAAEELPVTLDSSAGTCLEALARAAEELPPLLADAQERFDQEWMNKQGPDLPPALADLKQRSRYELLFATAASLPGGTAGLRNSSNRDETDLYQMCEEALEVEDFQKTGHLVLFSDGAHNGRSNDRILKRLREEGCGFTAVLLPDHAVSGVDPALQRWQVPPLVRAEKPASLTVTVRLPAQSSPPPSLRLLLDDQLLVERPLTGAPAGLSSHELVYPAPAAGRHTFRLELVAAEDSVPQNNVVYFLQETVAKEPKFLLIGDTPTWDTAYLSAAARRTGLELEQCYPAGGRPKRGAFSGSVPKTSEQWQRKSSVVLAGSPFLDFSAEDGTALFELVKKGGTLLLFGAAPGSYTDRLAQLFGWNPQDQKEVTGTLRLRPDQAHLPLVAVGEDPAVSTRLIADLPALTSLQGATAVPKQDLVLMETGGGVPLISMGFYGRGKVICFGLTGLYRLRDFTHRKTVDRLLDNLLAELARPLLPEKSEATIGIYPPLPLAGRSLTFIQWGNEPEEVTVNEEIKPAFAKGCGASLATVTPVEGSLRLKSGAREFRLKAIQNPGQEWLAPDLEQETLKHMADLAGGSYCSAAAASPLLRAINPGERSLTASAIYRPGRHWLVLLSVFVLFTFHWVIRKLSGLVL